MAMVFRTSGIRRFWVLGTALLLGGCATAPQPALYGAPPTGMPESIEVMFTTDPITGKSEGPFDPASGRRVETHIGDDGILRVVIDPVTGAPRLQPDKPKETPARP
jgi:hypothetical protein